MSVLSATGLVCGRSGHDDGERSGRPIPMVDELDSYRAIFGLATRERRPVRDLELDLSRR